MADREIHYLAYDPDKMWDEMHQTYLDHGGDLLFPGDEKEILLRTVLSILMTAYAAHDNAARMRTLRYAVSEYLDMLGENMGVPRREAQSAQTEIEITLRGASGTITFPEGSQFTLNGYLTFETTQYAAALADGEETKLTVPARCAEGGEHGNGIPAGTLLLPIEATATIAQVKTLSDTTGGRDREDDETYRARLIQSTFNSTVTGPEMQYVSRAMAVSSGILDASAVADETYLPGEPEKGAQYGLERGQVLITLLYRESVNTQDRESIRSAVYEALTEESARPLTDEVIVQEAEAIPFALHVKYLIREDADTDAQKQILEAAQTYRQWQCGALGRAFDPYRLTSLLYGAGCARVEILPESTVGGAGAEYTRIPKTHYLQGEITMEAGDDE